MSSAFEEQISELMAQFNRQRDELVKAKEEYEKSSVTALSKDRLVEVTLMLTGEVKDIKFHSTGYAGMPPAQLSAVLVETLNAARQKAAAMSQEAFDKHASFGSELRESLIGGDEADDPFQGLGSLLEMFGTGSKKPAGDEEDY